MLCSLIGLRDNHNHPTFEAALDHAVLVGNLQKEQKGGYDVYVITERGRAGAYFVPCTTNEEFHQLIHLMLEYGFSNDGDDDDDDDSN